jgi:hypothetical protein
MSRCEDGLVNRADALDALKPVWIGHRAGVGRSLSGLFDLLEPGEEVLAAASSVVDESESTVVVTTSRLLFFHTFPVWRKRSEWIPLALVKDVAAEEKWMSSLVTITTDDRRMPYRLKFADKDTAGLLAPILEKGRRSI